MSTRLVIKKKIFTYDLHTTRAILNRQYIAYPNWKPVFIVYQLFLIYVVSDWFGIPPVLSSD